MVDGGRQVDAAAAPERLVDFFQTVDPVPRRRPFDRSPRRSAKMGAATERPVRMDEAAADRKKRASSLRTNLHGPPAASCTPRRRRDEGLAAREIGRASGALEVAAIRPADAPAVHRHCIEVGVDFPHPGDGCTGVRERVGGGACGHGRVDQEMGWTQSLATGGVGDLAAGVVSGRGCQTQDCAVGGRLSAASIPGPA
jgi:hypothetical protein